MLRKVLGIMVVSAVVACGGSTEPNVHGLPRELLVYSMTGGNIASDADSTLSFQVYNGTLNRDGTFPITAEYVVKRGATTVRDYFDTLHWTFRIEGNQLIVQHAPDGAGITADTVAWSDERNVVIPVPMRFRLWNAAHATVLTVYFTN